MKAISAKIFRLPFSPHTSQQPSMQEGWMKAGSAPIVQLPHNPHTSQQPFVGSDVKESIRSLVSFRDVFVDRKRIQFGCKIMEGTCKRVKCECLLDNYFLFPCSF